MGRGFLPIPQEFTKLRCWSPLGGFSQREYRCSRRADLSLLPRVPCCQEPLERLPRLGRITGTNLVLDHLQNHRLQARIVRCSLLVRLIDSSGLPARPTVPLSFTFHLL